MIDTTGRWAVHTGESLAIMREIGDATVAAVICDPPYSSGGFTRGDRMSSTTNKYVLTGTLIERPDFAGDNRDQRGYLKWCIAWLDEALRITAPGGSLLMFTDWRQLPTTTDAVQAGGWVWRGIVPWDKGDGTRPRRGGFRSQAEYVVWGTAGALRDDYDRCAPGWLHVVDTPPQIEPGWIHAPVTQADKHHITGKPTELMRELAKICPPGELILDPFAGSGTTGVGALLEGRRFLGVEKIDAYAQIARERLAAVVSAPTLFDVGYDTAPLLFAPGGHIAHDGRDNTKMIGRSENTIRITIADALTLQSFRPDYPVTGTKTKQFEQIGNAIPPRLAEAILRQVG